MQDGGRREGGKREEEGGREERGKMEGGGRGPFPLVPSWSLKLLGFSLFAEAMSSDSFMGLVSEHNKCISMCFCFALVL